MTKQTRLIIYQVIFFAFLLLSDLLSKHFIMKFLSEHTVGYYVVIDKVLSLKYSLNDGAGFGIFSGKQGFLIAFTSVALILISGLLVFFHAKKDTQKRGGVLLVTSLVMILAGGVGNLVDRIAFGYVRDFIEYKFVETLFNRSFAICNIADVQLTLGVILLIVYVLFFYDDRKKSQKELAGNQTICSKDTASNRAEDEANIMTALKMYEDKHCKTTGGDSEAQHEEHSCTNVDDKTEEESDRMI